MSAVSEDRFRLVTIYGQDYLMLKHKSIRIIKNVMGYIWKIKN